MKIYPSENICFEIDIPEVWSTTKLVPGARITGSDHYEISFEGPGKKHIHILVEHLQLSELNQSEMTIKLAFLEFLDISGCGKPRSSRIRVGDKYHYCCKYYMYYGVLRFILLKKYLLRFGEREYAITCSLLNGFLFGKKSVVVEKERENEYDQIISTFKLLGSP